MGRERLTKMRLKRRNVGVWRLAAFAALFGVLVLGGAAKVSRATTNGVLVATVTVLNDQSTLVLGTPTPGKNIGYDINLANPIDNPNTLNHIAFTDSIPGGKIVYLHADPGVTCSGTTTLSCTSQQLSSGASIDVIVLFQTDKNGTGSFDNTLNGTYAPASLNTKNNRTDPTKTFTVTTPRSYADTFSGSVAQSLALPSDSLSAGGPGQSSSIQLPPGFVNSNNYVGTTLQNLSGTAATVPPLTVCGTCLHFETDVTIPLATNYSTAGPFLNALLQGTPYTFTVRIPAGLLPNGFKPNGVWHEDGAGQVVQLTACAVDSSNNPIPLTTDPGICIASLTQLKPSKDVLAVVLGFSNGRYWVG
jgi:hypothetical protein